MSRSVPIVAAGQAAAPAAHAFQTVQVLTIAGGHFIHDMFTSFPAPLLPALITKLGMSLTMASSLSAFMQLPSLINPLLGVWADRGNLRWLVILSPTVTAISMSLIGLAPSYALLVLLLMVAGFSTAAWHVPTPVLIVRASGKRVGQGMSFFMLGGEMARTLGPLLAVAAVAWWGMEGMYRLIVLGVAASLVLYWRLGHAPVQTSSHTNGSWLEAWHDLRRVLFPVTGVILANGFMTSALGIFLPTLLSSEGASLWLAGGALSIMELAAAAGAMAGGTLSDRVGRQRILALALLLSPALMAIFLAAQGWLIFPALVALGFVNFSINPVLMALIQEYGHKRPATANGLYMAISFVGRSAIMIAVGAMADLWGLRAMFGWSAALCLVGLPFVWLLPAGQRGKKAADAPL